MTPNGDVTMTKDNSETNTTSPKISGNERNMAALAYLTTFFLPLALFLDLSAPMGGAVGALICGLIYWRNKRTSEFVTNHSRKAAKINLVCTIAIALIDLLFFYSINRPAFLLGYLSLPFIFGGPLIGWVSIFSIYTHNENL